MHEVGGRGVVEREDQEVLQASLETLVAVLEQVVEDGLHVLLDDVLKIGSVADGGEDAHEGAEGLLSVLVLEVQFQRMEVVEHFESVLEQQRKNAAFCLVELLRIRRTLQLQHPLLLLLLNAI